MLKKISTNNKIFKDIEYDIVIVCVMITLFGCLNISQAGSIEHARAQLTWMIIGLIGMAVVTYIDYKYIEVFIEFAYIAIIILLIAVLFTTPINGARRWLDLGFMSFQPSEFAVPIVLMIVAKKINDMDGDINNIKNLFKLALYVVVPTFLIIIEPDMGMTMVMFYTLLAAVFIADIDSRILIAGLVGVIVAIILAWQLGFIQPYQMARFFAFMDTEADVLGANFQLNRALTGIGAGGIMGAGFGKGVQIDFVPENHTDFIFSAIGEEWGFVGAIFLLLLYAYLIYKLMCVSRDSKDHFGKVVCAGIAGNFLFGITQNIGMNIGILPISGITLPFVSYGGTSLLKNYLLIGLVLNVGIRKKKLNF